MARPALHTTVRSPTYNIVQRTVGTFAVLLLALPATVRADRLAEVKQRGVLIWGADKEGGAPFVFLDSADPNHIVGFEVELADLLAHDLGVQAQFFQADWSTLPEFLRKGEIDLVLNGYEWTPQRVARMAATRPYYLYELQLLARENDSSLKSWDDLRLRPGWRRRQVAVLGGSAAAEYLQANWGAHVSIVEYLGNTDAMLQVRQGVHDATLADVPIALYYRDRPQGRGLRFVGPAVGRGYYVAFARKGEDRLVAALNQSIQAAIDDGRLRTIYERYQLWNPTQEELAKASPTASTEALVSGWAVVRRYGPTLLAAAGMTVLLSVLSMPIAVVIGLFVALGRLYGPRLLRRFLGLYVEVLRGTPIMLQLYVLFFVLPGLLPFSLSPVVAAIAGLAINYSAYEAEIYRAGLQAIPVGQMEAALALGMTRATALRRVVVPQAVRIVVPPVTNDFIALFKDTSVCSVIAVTELTKQYNVLANSTGAILELAAMTAFLYLAMSYPLSIVAGRMERRLNVQRPAGGN